MPSVFPALPGLLFALRPVVTVLVVVGFVAWHRDHGLDPTVVIAPLYLAQSLSYPFINERRVVLILPLVLVWLLVGARVSSAGVGRLWSAAPAAVRRGTQRGGRWRPLAGPVALTLCAAVLVPLLTVQFGRNYRLPAGLETSKLQGSSYVHALRAITESHEDIASSYRWAVAAFTHRDTLNTVHFHPCGGSPGSENVHAGKLELLRAHTYGAVLLGALNTPWGFDDRCTLRVLEQNPAWAVRIHRQPRDKAIVFQLIGPGTANPALSDVTRARPVHASGATLREEREPPYVAGEASGRYHILEPTGQTRDRATLTVPFHGPAPVTQVSLGAAGQPVGAADSIAVELRATDGRWIRAWSARGVDVDTREQGPDIVVRGFDTPATATAVRVAFRGRGPFEVHDLHVLARTGHRDEPALE